MVLYSNGKFHEILKGGLVERMKEVYHIPEMEVVEFESEDIITASSNLGSDELPFISAQ